MVWFSDSYYFDKIVLKVVYIIDCYLFKEFNGDYFFVNMVVYFVCCLYVIVELDVDCVVFGGDLI